MMVDKVCMLGIIFNLILFTIGIIKLKGIKYLKDYEFHPEDCTYSPKSDAVWHTIKFPIIAWIILFIMNLVVPFLGGVLSFAIFDLYVKDIQDSYCRVIKTKTFTRICSFMQAFSKLIAKSLDWLYYKL